MSMKAFNFFVSSQRKSLRPANTDNSASAVNSQQLQNGTSQGFIPPQPLPVAGEDSGSVDDGEFRCKTCFRGPPLTKKYAKNQCQTCYKKEKKMQKEGHHDMHSHYQAMNGYRMHQEMGHGYQNFPPQLLNGYYQQ